MGNKRRLTVFPALSKPRINMQYSSFLKVYFQSPDSNVYITEMLIAKLDVMIKSYVMFYVFSKL